MIKNIFYRNLAFTLLLSSPLLISGCSNNNNDNRRSFSVSFSNLTANQPLSPLGLVIHDAGYHAWVDGEAASVALEKLAEGGDNSELLADARANAAHLNSTSGTTPIGPGASEQFEIAADDGRNASLSLFSMLVNTNDAYTGLNAHTLGNLAIGEVVNIDLPAWDAGTESNSEAVGTLPGPADGGEGFNTARDDLLDKVTFHQGVVTQDDGFATSVLNQSHRFDNPVARVSITRTE